MGADIHGPYIEYRAYDKNSHAGETWYGIAKMDGGRDYRAFGLMAGVRSRALPVVEIHRGYPDNMDHEARQHSQEWPDDCHSASWLTLDEMRTVVAAYRSNTQDAGDLDPHDYSEQYTFVDLCIVLMAEVELRWGKPTRAVFCFDN